MMVFESDFGFSLNEFAGDESGMLSPCLFGEDWSPGFSGHTHLNLNLPIHHASSMDHHPLGGTDIHHPPLDHHKHNRLSHHHNHLNVPQVLLFCVLSNHFPILNHLRILTKRVSSWIAKFNTTTITITITITIGFTITITITIIPLSTLTSPSP